MPINHHLCWIEISHKILTQIIGKNENFKNFIENVIADIDVERSRISKSLYDEIKTDEKLEHYMRQKKIEGF